MAQPHFNESIQCVFVQPIDFDWRHLIDDPRLNELMKVHVVFVNAIFHQHIGRNDIELVAGAFDCFELINKSEHIVIALVQNLLHNVIDAIFALQPNVTDASNQLFQCSSVRFRFGQQYLEASFVL